MPFKMSATVVGHKGLRASLAAFSHDLRTRVLREAADRTGKEIQRIAKQKVRRETGQLRQALRTKVAVYPNTPAAVAVIGPQYGYKKVVIRKRGKWSQARAESNPIRYAHLVELGTVRTAAYPYLRPALEAGAAFGVKAMADVLKDAVRGAGK